MAADTTVVVDIDAIYYGEKLKNKGILVLPACSHEGGCKFLCTNCRLYRDSHEDLYVVFENVRDNTTDRIITVMRKRRYTYIRPTNEFIRWDYTTEWAEDPNIMYLLTFGFVKIDTEPSDDKPETTLLVYDVLVEKFVPFGEYYGTKGETIKVCSLCWADAICKESTLGRSLGGSMIYNGETYNPFEIKVRKPKVYSEGRGEEIK